MESLTKRLDAMHPDRPSCEKIALRDKVDSVLLAECADEKYQGLTNIEALVLSTVQYAIKHPESKVVSLGDVSKVTAPRKEEKAAEDPSKKVLELYVRFDEPAQEVLDVGEGYKG